MEQGQLTDENLSQGDLTQEELVLLNNLMYIQDNKRKIRSDITNYEGKTLKKFIQDYSSNNYEKIDELPEGATDTTHKEWKAMIEKIRQDDKLMNLKITDKLNDDKGGNAVCLEDPNNHDKATVVFRGTGKYEWIDNGIGGYSTMSNQQKEVINWVNSLPYKEITSSGHSKGGNKSMLVAILCPNVVRCVALDGQGFSPEFYDEYIDEINKNKDKITLICSQGDYVNGLFINHINDIEGYNPLYFKKWPQWDELDVVKGRLSVDGCHMFIDKYYNYLIDKNDESIKKINEIFEKVYEKDKEYGYNLHEVCNKLQEVQQNVIKITQRYNTSKVNVNKSLLQTN